MKLIVGLGNPGENYRKTRHNLGAECVAAFAQKHGLSLKKEQKFHSLFASGIIYRPVRGEGSTFLNSKNEEKVTLLLPLTYMNRSGVAVKKVINFFKISSQFDFSSILVVVDDVYLKFGTLRFRFSGSSGGHNGLKDIEAQLGSQEYSRLRMGIKPQSSSNEKLEIDVPLERYVLDPFSSEEQKEVSQFLQKGIAAIETWLFGSDML